MAFENLLKSTIQDFESGGLKNEEFSCKAHQLYDAFNSYPCPQISVDNAYLMGIIFSDLALAEKENRDFSDKAVGSAAYCYLEVIEKGTDLHMRQGAAVKLTILLERESESISKFFTAFRKYKGTEIFLEPKMSEDGQIDLDAYDSELLKELGMYCVNFVTSVKEHESLSEAEKKHFESIKTSRKFHVENPKLKVSLRKVSRMLADFITEHVTMSEQRCLSLINFCF